MCPTFFQTLKLKYVTKSVFSYFCGFRHRSPIQVSIVGVKSIYRSYVLFTIYFRILISLQASLLNCFEQIQRDQYPKRLSDRVATTRSIRNFRSHTYRVGVQYRGKFCCNKLTRRIQIHIDFKGHLVSCDFTFCF